MSKISDIIHSVFPQSSLLHSHPVNEGRLNEGIYIHTLSGRFSHYRIVEKISSRKSERDVARCIMKLNQWNLNSSIRKTLPTVYEIIRSDGYFHIFMSFVYNVGARHTPDENTARIIVSGLSDIRKLACDGALKPRDRNPDALTELLRRADMDEHVAFFEDCLILYNELPLVISHNDTHFGNIAITNGLLFDRITFIDIEAIYPSRIGSCLHYFAQLSVNCDSYSLFFDKLTQLYAEAFQSSPEQIRRSGLFECIIKRLYLIERHQRNSNIGKRNYNAKIAKRLFEKMRV